MGRTKCRDSVSSFPYFRFHSFNPCGNSVNKNLLAVDRVRKDLTENTGLDLGHETNVGCQEAEKGAFLNSRLHVAHCGWGWLVNFDSWWGFMGLESMISELNRIQIMKSCIQKKWLTFC